MPRIVALCAEPRAFPTEVSRKVSRTLVVTPNPRAAEARGVPFVSLDTLARRVLRKAGYLVAPDLATRRVLRQVVEEGLAPQDVPGTARVICAAVSELLRIGLPEGSLGARLTPKVEALLELTRRYRDLLGEKKLVDAAEVVVRAAALVQERVPIEVRGYPRLGWGDLAFVDALADEGSVLVLPHLGGGLFGANEVAAGYLRGQGWQVQTHDSEAATIGQHLSRHYALGGPVRDEGVTATLHPDMESEVRAVLTQVKALLHNGVDAKAVALVARQDDLYGPLVKAVAWEYELPVKCFYGLPARQTRVGAWLSLLLEVLRSRFAFEATSRFLAHPLSEGLPRELWQEVRKRPPRDLGEWLERASHLGALDWSEHASARAYLETLQGTLRAFDIEARTLADPQSRVLLHRFIAASMKLDADGAMPLATFVGVLGELLDGLSAPSDPAGGGVALHTPLSIFGASYHSVFVMGLAEGVLPAAIREDPALGFGARNELRAAGLPVESAAEAARRERLSLWAALETAREAVWLSFPQQLGRRPLLPSPLFARLELAPRPPATKRCAGIEEARAALLLGAPDLDEVDEVHRLARAAYAVETRRESAAPADEYDGVTGEPLFLSEHVFSASQLVTLGQCPYRWFAQRVLHLEEPEEAETDLSPTLRGTLYHRTLELALGAALDADDQRAAALDALKKAFERAEEELGALHLPAWTWRRAEHLAALRRLLASDTFFEEGARVIAVEARFEASWRGLRMRGVIDRVERTPDGLGLIDYKTSSQKPKGAKNARGEASVDVQLPLYLEAAATLFPGEPVKAARYYSLTKAKVISEAKVNDDELDALVTRVRQHLGAGSFPVAPDVQGYACTYCAYDALCRKGPRLDRKEADA